MRLPLMAVAALALQLSESIEVRVVNVDVVVADRDGKPVTGLTKDDFEIFEDKKPQVITNFYEVRGGVPAETGAENGADPMEPRRHRHPHGAPRRADRGATTPAGAGGHECGHGEAAPKGDTLSGGDPQVS